jgi:hypothetical protein
MVYKQVLFPDKKNHSVEMPERFFGKKVEVTVVEIESNSNFNHPVPPAGNPTDANSLFENFGHAPDFPSADTTRQQTWPSKW